MSAAVVPPPPAFLVGCARSGTSILGETLAAHPRVTYLFEASKLWKGIFEEREDDRLAPADAADPAGLARLHAAFDAARKDPRRDLLLEKNPKHALRVGFLDAAFPGCRILHLLRDGRDVVASLMFRNRGPDWGHLKIPGWRELLARHPDENHLRCAHQWREAVRCARAEGAPLGPARYLELRYEELVREPAPVLERALNFLGLESSPQVLAAAARIQDATAGSYHAKGQVRHFVDDHARRVGRFAENLTAEQLDGVLAVAGDLLVELGYV